MPFGESALGQQTALTFPVFDKPKSIIYTHPHTYYNQGFCLNCKVFCFWNASEKLPQR
jgi:hypothetical protein